MNQRLAYASQRAEVLFGCYRRGDANDPERYVAAIAAVLSSYDFELIKEVTDPRTGICTSEKFMTFMPNAGELKVYCEAQAARKERMKRLRDLPRPDFTRNRLPAPPAGPGALAQVFVAIGHERYSALVAWAQTAEPKYWRFGKASDGRLGILVAYGVWSSDPTFMSSIGAAAAKIAKDVKPSEAAE